MLVVMNLVKNFAGTLLLMIWAGQVLAQNHLIAIFSVDAGKYERINTPVSADITGLPLKIATHDIELVEVTGGDRSIVKSQLEMGRRDRLWWVLEGSTAAGQERTFELHLVEKMTKSTEVQLSDTRSAIQFQIGGNEVLQYVYEKPSVPEGVDEVFSRAGYIHPLKSPNGTRLTRIQPPDHYHHYGIWNPWTHTEFEGKEIDFWNLNKRQATVDVAGPPSIVEGNVFGELHAQHNHRVKGQDGGDDKIALHESWNIRVYNADPEQEVFLVDINSALSCASESPLTITEYRYQGFGFRATEVWDDKNTQLKTSQGFDKSNGNATRARWCDIRGPGVEGTSGISFMTHPSNYNFPEQLRIWPVGANKGVENVFLNFNPAQDRDWHLEPGNQYALKYRLVVYDGSMDSSTLERYWADYGHPPRVTMTPVGQLEGKKVLVYIKNGEGYVHENRAASVAAIEKLGAENGFLVSWSEDPALFTSDSLWDFDALIFSNTNNEGFDTEEQKSAFKKYIRSGRGFVGIHSATGSERDWSWYSQMIGGQFLRHPPYQPFKINVLDRTNPSTSFLPEVWEWEDECYYFKELNPDIQVLMAADLTTVEDKRRSEYPDDTFGDQFPLAWCHQFEGGRQWYTALGHQSAHYSDARFMAHILGGIQWVLAE